MKTCRMELEFRGNRGALQRLAENISDGSFWRMPDGLEGRGLRDWCRYNLGTDGVFTGIRWNGSVLTLDFPYYDSSFRLTAFMTGYCRLTGTAMSGWWATEDGMHCGTVDFNPGDFCCAKRVKYGEDAAKIRMMLW